MFPYPYSDPDPAKRHGSDQIRIHNTENNRLITRDHPLFLPVSWSYRCRRRAWCWGNGRPAWRCTCTSATWSTGPDYQPRINTMIIHCSCDGCTYFDTGSEYARIRLRVTWFLLFFWEKVWTLRRIQMWFWTYCIYNIRYWIFWTVSCAFSFKVHVKCRIRIRFETNRDPFGLIQVYNRTDTVVVRKKFYILPLLKSTCWEPYFTLIRAWMHLLPSKPLNSELFIHFIHVT